LHFLYRMCPRSDVRIFCKSFGHVPICSGSYSNTLLIHRRTSIRILLYGRPEFESPQGQGSFLFATVSRPAVGPTQPFIQGVPRSLSTEVKGPDRGTDHSLPCSTKVKNAWGYSSTLPCVFMAWYLV